MTAGPDDASVAALAPDEPAGDMGDQASRLQMAQEQEAIRAALEGRVRGTDAYDDRGPLVEPLEGEDPLADDEAEASDDPVHAGGDAAAVPDERVTVTLSDELAEVMAVDEGSSVDDEEDQAVPRFEDDGDPEAGGPETD